MAEQVLAKMISNVAKGEVGLPLDYSDAPTLEELFTPWVERRAKTHRSGGDDRSRWRTHLGPAFGKMRPAEVDAIAIRRFIETKLAKGLAPATVGNCVRLLSVFFGHVVKLGHAPQNPVAALPETTRTLYRSDYDTTSTPFLRSWADVRRVFLALPEPVNVAFAVGAFAGLRPGEILGLFWEDIDLEDQVIHVYQQVQDGEACVPKDGTRLVPLGDTLLPILGSWRVTTGGVGQVIPPMRGGSRKWLNPHTLGKNLRAALAVCGLPGMTWYQATRHTFSTLWAKEGRSLAVLKKILGHTQFSDTERYVHVEPDLAAHEILKAFG